MSMERKEKIDGEGEVGVGSSDVAELVCGFIGPPLETRCYPLAVGSLLIEVFTGCCLVGVYCV